MWLNVIPVHEIARNATVAMPLVRSLQRRRAALGEVIDPATMVHWAEQVRAVAAANGIDLTSGDTSVVELGPGHPIGVAALLGATAPARITVLEAEPTAGRRPEAQAGSWPITDSSVDFVYSFLAAEHFRRPELVLQRIKLALRPGGVAMIMVDLRDHRDLYGNQLDFLRFGERTWNAMTSRRGCWTNRLRPSEWVALLDRHFDVLDAKVDIGELPAKFRRDRLAPRFRNLPFQELRATNVTFVVQHAMATPSSDVTSRTWSSLSITSADTTS